MEHDNFGQRMDAIDIQKGRQPSGCYAAFILNSASDGTFYAEFIPNPKSMDGMTANPFAGFDRNAGCL